ncbi:MAG: DUF3303 domain-containing protein [Candidatus Aminicenantales bacterium]
MLFMTVYTYEPENHEAVIKKRVEGGKLVPSGVKIIGEWSAVGAGRVFRLVESDSMPALHAAVHPWSNLGKTKTYPVMPVDDVIKLLTAK